MDYELLFLPRRPDESDPDSAAVLLPVLIAEDGRRVVLTKAVNTVEKALSFHTGFALALFVEETGFDQVEEHAKANSAAGKDDGVRKAAD